MDQMEKDHHRDYRAKAKADELRRAIEAFMQDDDAKPVRTPALESGLKRVALDLGSQSAMIVRRWD